MKSMKHGVASPQMLRSVMWCLPSSFLVPSNTGRMMFKEYRKGIESTDFTQTCVRRITLSYRRMGKSLGRYLFVFIPSYLHSNSLLIKQTLNLFLVAIKILPYSNNNPSPLPNSTYLTPSSFSPFPIISPSIPSLFTVSPTRQISTANSQTHSLASPHRASRPSI